MRQNGYKITGDSSDAPILTAGKYAVARIPFSLSSNDDQRSYGSRDSAQGTSDGDPLHGAVIFPFGFAGNDNL